MITHDQVESVVKHLDWQIAAWKRIQERHPEEKAFTHHQVDYLQGKIEQLKEWDSAHWATDNNQ